MMRREDLLARACSYGSASCFERECIVKVSDADLASLGYVKLDRIDEEVWRLYQTFNPPAEMSINEKQAWREGLIHAVEFLLAAINGGQE